MDLYALLVIILLVILIIVLIRFSKIYEEHIEIEKKE
jgi:hypothetical protein